MLRGIVEADETYVGGKPRKRNRRPDGGGNAPRGRGTSKTPVIGAAERGGKVVARVADDLSGCFLLSYDVFHGSVVFFHELLYGGAVRSC